MAAYDLLIFDLDGTLVPTEELAIRVTAPIMREVLNLQLTDEELSLRYRGRDLDYQYADMAELYGGELPQTFRESLTAAWIKAVEDELEPSLGVLDALEVLRSIPRCIASNNTPAGIEFTLRSTGLDEYFGSYVSSEDVENPKPAPDMFVLAANRMGVPVERCLVIEDTPLGVRAAVAAGMFVVGYAGNATANEDELRAEGAVVIHHFDELPALVNA